MSGPGIDRPRRRSPIWGLLLLVILAVSTAGVFPFRQILAQQSQVDRAREKLETITAENARLEARMAALETDLEVERIAREGLGMVRPGEVGYVVEWVDVEQAPPVTLPPEDLRPWYSKLWDFVSGHDYQPSGDG